MKRVKNTAHRTGHIKRLREYNLGFEKRKIDPAQQSISPARLELGKIHRLFLIDCWAGPKKQLIHPQGKPWGFSADSGKVKDRKRAKKFGKFFKNPVHHSLQRGIFKKRTQYFHFYW